jgi:hypothetical protein
MLLGLLKSGSVKALTTPAQKAMRIAILNENMVRDSRD